MTEENDIKILADSFFQSESYVGDSAKGNYKQINLNKVIPIIRKAKTKTLIEAYNLALKRVKELIDRKFNALFYLGKDKEFNLKEYLDLEIPIIYSYMVRIYEIRNALLMANNRNINIAQKRSTINRLFGEFDDVFFLEDEIYKFIPEKNKNDKKVLELVSYIKKEYVKYFERKEVIKIR